MLNTDNFQSRLQEICTDFSEKTFLLCVSGGADSMVMLALFKALNCNFQVAHINYHLRGKDSDDDQNLVAEVCALNNIKLHVYEVSAQDKKPKGSIQLWARNLRYRFFEKIRAQENLDQIVTAHHLNDALETFLINLSKASGIRGLSGIPANENGILRPLLHFSKEEIYQFAQENKILFREDSSNAKNDYLRNKIRNTIVPDLMELNPQFLKNFESSVEHLHQTKNFVEEKVKEFQKKISSKISDVILISKTELFAQSKFLQFEILNQYGFSAEKEIAKIAKAETGKTFRSPTFQLTVDFETLNIRKISSETEEEKKPESFSLTIKNNRIEIPETEQFNFANKQQNWSFDADKIKLPLQLRRNHTSDIFFPIGTMVRKKITKFFKDEKIPILARQNSWVLCDAADQILGIFPIIQDRRATADHKTKNILTLNL